MPEDVGIHKLKDNAGKSRIPMMKAGFLLFAAAVIISTAGMLCLPIPVRDVASRYAPMADAFASGNVLFAFHPRVPLLHPLIGGVISFLTGLNGYHACQITSILFFALTVFPLLAAFERAAGRQAAIVSCVLYVTCPYLVELAFSGMRDSLKSFVVALAAYGVILVYQERERLSGYVLVGIAAGLGLMTRAEMALTGMLMLIGVCAMEIRGCKGCLKSVISLIIFFMFAVPQSYVNLQMTGIFLTEFRLGIVFEEILHINPGPMQVSIVMLAAVPAFCIAGCLVALLDGAMSKKYSVLFRVIMVLLVLTFVSAVFLAPAEDASTRLHFVHQLVKGVYAPYAIVSAIMIVILLASKNWKREYTILLALLCAYDALCVLQIWVFEKNLYVSDRYLITAAPLHFIFAGMFVLMLFELQRAYPRDGKFAREVKVIPAVSAAVFVIVMLLLALWPTGWKYASPKWSAYNGMIFDVSNTIKADWKGEKTRSLDKIVLETYQPCGAPGIFFPMDDKRDARVSKLSAVSYLSNGHVELRREDADYAFLRTDANTLTEFPQEEWTAAKTYKWNGGTYVLFRHIRK